MRSTILYKYLLFFLFCFALLGLMLTVPLSYSSNAPAKEHGSVSIVDDKGVRISMNDFEFYFNATNGGEITQYYDLSVDPGRSRNLVNLGWKPFNNLCPLFSSMFYNPYSGSFLTTGGDRDATVALIADTGDYVILQTASRIMDSTGALRAFYVHSTWIIRSDGLVTVERTVLVPTQTTVPSGWRWYPFFLTRAAAFGPNSTFTMFNTTYSSTAVVNESSYRNVFDTFPVLPKDTSSIFGVGLSFSNITDGGDGTHNILVSYKYDELIAVNEWRTDNYYSLSNNILEGGPVYEFSNPANFYTHTYHMMAKFTHDPLDDQSVQSFASYYASHTSMATLIDCSVATNQDSYKIGDQYAFDASGTSYYDFTGLTAKLSVADSTGRPVYSRIYGPGNIVAEQSFSVTLLSGTIPPSSAPGDYTLSFQMLSSEGIQIASSTKAFAISP